MGRTHAGREVKGLMPCSPEAELVWFTGRSLEDGGGINSEAVQGLGRGNRTTLTYRQQARVCLQTPNTGTFCLALEIKKIIS